MEILDGQNSDSADKIPSLLEMRTQDLFRNRRPSSYKRKVTRAVFWRLPNKPPSTRQRSYEEYRYLEFNGLNY